MKKIILIAIVAMAVLNSCNEKPSSDDERFNIDLTPTQKQMISDNNDFAFNVFRATQSESSQIISPLSVTFALSMLNNGAVGETHQQIKDVLGFGEQQSDEINVLCKKILTEAPTLDKRTKSLIANTIFVNDGYTLKPTFVNKAKEFYNAEPKNYDFNDYATLDAINKWASDNTERMITKALSEDEYDVTCVSYLLNAIYFKGTWTYKFKEKDTREESFNDGGNVPMMHQNNYFMYAENDTYQMLEMPYGNGAYNMSVILPKENKTTDDVLNMLNAQSWKEINSQKLNYQVDVKLPRFETESDINLKQVMSGLGMPKAFTTQAEFDEFCDTPTFIGLMKQIAKIKLDEEGTEAAAVTAVGFNTTVAEPDLLYAQFHANRSFLYIIWEQSTEAIFFIGKYTGQ